MSSCEHYGTKLTGIFFLRPPIHLRGPGDDHLPLAVWVEWRRTLEHPVEDPWAMVRRKIKLIAGGTGQLTIAQISGKAPPQFIDRCGGLKIGAR